MRSKVSLLHISFARLFYSLQQWAVVSILAHGGNSSALATFGLASAIVIPSIGLIGFGLRQGVATDVNREYHFWQYVSIRIFSLIIGIVCVIAFVRAAYGPSAVLGMVAVYLFPKSVELMSELCYGFMQRQDKITHISIAMTLRAVVGTIGFVVAWSLTHDVTIAMTAWGATWLLILLAVEIPWAYRGERVPGLADDSAGSRSVASLASILWLHLPLSLSALIGNLVISAPRLILDQFGTSKELAALTAMSAAFQAMNTFMVALLQMLMTPLADAISKEQQKRAKKIVMKASVWVLSVSVLMLISIALFGGPMLALAYGKSFGDYKIPFLLLAVVWLARYAAIVFRYVPTARRKFWNGIGLDVFSLIFVGIGCFAGGVWGGTLTSLIFGLIIGQFVSSLQTILKGYYWLMQPRDVR